MNNFKFKRFLGYIAAFFAMALVSCDPLEEVYQELDDAASGTVSADLTITLTEADYGVADDACGCARFDNFSSDADVRVGIPAVLTNNYPALGDGSSAVVTYDFYNGSSPDLRGTLFEYTVSSAEYTELLFSFGNFSNLSRDIPLYADLKEPGAEDGDHMDITHQFWTGSMVETRTTRAVYTVAYGWQWASELPLDAYGDFFGESGTDFSNAGEGRDKIPAYLNYLLSTGDNLNDLTVEEGETLVVQYLYDDRCFGPDCEDPGEPDVPDVGLFVFSGGEWLLYNDHFQITQATLSFGHDGNDWVPDNTIKVTLGGSDYGAIAAQYAGTPNGDNLDQFGNFNRQGGATHWSNEVIIEALGWWLDNVNPGTVTDEGQKYLITTAGYNGANITEEWALIRTGGEWVLQD